MSQFLFTDPEPIEGILQIPAKDVEVCIRKNRRIFSYQYQNSKWKKTWEELIFEEIGEYSFKAYPWMISNKVLPGKNVLMIRHPHGIRFYEINSDKSGLTLLREDNNFHELYDLIVVFGAFYPDRNWVGVISRNAEGEVKFYAATKDSFDDEEEEDTLFLLNQPTLTPEWNNSDFFVVKLHKDDREVIGLRNEAGLEFFEFNEAYQLTSVVRTVFGRKSNDDAMFLANLTNGYLKDIVVFNKEGLHVYKYDKTYSLLSVDAEFGRNWSSDFVETVLFSDLNSDGRDELIFTGHDGLIVMTYDGSRWEKLVGSNGRTYGKVVGVLPALSSLFIEDGKGLRWTVENYSSIKTTSKPITTTTTSTARYYDNNYVSLQEIERKEYTDKPILRWAEQLDSSFLKESVNINNGHVALGIPFIDVSTLTGWKIQLSLSYSSQPQYSEILGIGWHLSVAQDYVFVDYQGSIFPSDAVYYLVMQGNLYRLKFKSKKGNVVTYKISEDMDTEIQYHRAEEKWIIRGISEVVTYGKASDSTAKDALAYGLSWPNWRLDGTDKTKLRKIITSWYLNRRFDKNTEQSLYYYYDQDDGMLGYTLAMRLRTITDGDTKVSFNYADRNSDEYTINEDLHLPMPQVHTKYLTNCSVDAYNYKQVINFEYEVRKGKRLLNRISQSSLETVFEFSYDNVNEKFLLKNCKLLPHGISVDYDYGFFTRPSVAAIFDNMIKYHIMDKPKMGSWNDYSVLGYIDGELKLQILNQHMTHVIFDSKISIDGEIKDYVVEAYDDEFFVFVITKDQKLMYIYTRDKKKWSDKSVSYSFHKNDEVRFGKNFIAVAKTSSIELYFRKDNKSDWKITSFPISKSLVYFVNYQKTIVGYDNSELIVFYLDDDLNWNKKVVGTFKNFEKNSNNVVNSFDLTEENKNNLKSGLRHGGLQIFNNFIVLNELKDNGGQLFFNINLILLNEKYEIGTSRTFTIYREYVYDLSFEHPSNDKLYTYKFGYVKDDGLYKIRVMDVYGEEISNMRNKNHRFDTVERLKEVMNNDEEFKKSARKTMFLLDWGSYQIQITPNGVVIGNEALRFNGVDWERKPYPKSQTLGKHFKLEASSDKKEITLYKNAEVIKEMDLFEANQILNRYPGYLAYYSKNDTINLVSFKDDENIGDEHIIVSEKVLPAESNAQNFVTVRDNELIIRPVDALQAPKPEVFVKKNGIKQWRSRKRNRLQAWI